MKLLNITLIVLLAAFVACTGNSGTKDKEKKEIKQEQIIGNWEVFSAKRDGHKTQSINGASFLISPNGQVATNLLGNDQNFNYTLNDTIIVTKGIQNIDYHILGLTDSTLELSTQIQKRRFVFNLMKAKE